MSKANTSVNDSSKKICQALLALMHDKKFDDITVGEITQAAGLSRRTFYRMFSNKFEVLVQYFQDIADDYTFRLEPMESFDIYQLSLDFFTFWDINRDFMNFLHKNAMECVFAQELNRMSVQHLDYRFRNLKISDEVRESSLYFLSGGFTTLLFFWLDADSECTAEEFASKFSKSIRSIVRTNYVFDGAKPTHDHLAEDKYAEESVQS